MLGEKAAGTSHNGRGTPCQDAFAYRTFGVYGEWLVVAVADGAGTASHSEIGSVLACEELVKRVENSEPKILSFHEEALSVFHGVRTALIAEAERLQVRPRELACTLLLAVVGPDGATFAQVGDGAIVFHDGLAYQTAFWPEPSEYANATDFLTDDNYANAFRHSAVTLAICDLAIFTDGIQRLALDFGAKRPYAEFFGPLFREIKTSAQPETLSVALAGFLNSPRINERTDDDKTLVLAVRLP